MCSWIRARSTSASLTQTGTRSTTSRAVTDPDDAPAADHSGVHPISAATVRKLWPTEGHLFRDHLLRLDRDSRRLRFAHGVSDSFIEDYAARKGVTLTRAEQLLGQSLAYRPV